MHCIDFSDSDLRSSIFEGSDLEAFRFSSSRLDLCNFKNATNISIDINENSIKGATFKIIHRNPSYCLIARFSSK
tara:strand:- start:126 stop:350 length:225 start_codon:yes stop_codon:yes gene_type:complete